METIRISPIELSVRNGQFYRRIDEGEVLFDSKSYSRFKYGYRVPAKLYAYLLFTHVDQKLWEISAGKRVIVVSAPYKHVPTASHLIAVDLCNMLSQSAVRRGIEPPVLVHLQKSKPGTSTYAKSSEAERAQELCSLGLHIDESLVSDSHVLVVDDIRITGSAERATARYLEPLKPASVWYLHAATLPEDVGKKHPQTEDQLNQAVPPELSEVIRYYEQGDFRLNTRVLRYILEAPFDTMHEFAWNAPLPLLTEIYHGAVGSGAAYYAEHRTSLELIRQRYLSQMHTDLIR